MDYTAYDATGLAASIRAQEITAVEAVEAAIAEIERHEPHVNAVVHRRFEEALAEAAQPLGDGPFAGVPYLLKDLHAAMAGVPLTNANRAMRRHLPARDAELVRRLRRSGLIVVGKSNTPEFGLAPVTEPELHGPTRNPWNLSLTPGGSSGGSAAAVAYRGVPAAHASDGGGSIRIPASACGLFGLKPTRGRNPHGPDLGEGWFGLSEQHALTRSVRDSARLLDATHGADVGAPYVAPPPEQAFSAEVGAEPGRLRIAFFEGSLLSEVDMHPDTVAAVARAAQLCESLGHDVYTARPAINATDLQAAFVVLAAAGAALDVEAAARIVRRDPRSEDYEPVTWLLYQIARKTPAATLAAAIETSRMAGRSMGAFMAEADVFVCATLVRPPWPIGELSPSPTEQRILQVVRRAPVRKLMEILADQLASEILDPIPNTPLFNMTGQPAMSVPLHWNDAGLPIGVQFAGRFGDEATLFRLAAQLEEAAPWADRRPPGV